MQPGANASAFFVPCQPSTGCGALHRRSPTGGAANGMPLNDTTPSCSTPATFPPVTAAVVTCADVDKAITPVSATARLAMILFMKIPPLTIAQNLVPKDRSPQE